MDAVEYIKTLARICGTEPRCSDCEIISACFIKRKNPEAMVNAVEKWAKEHPTKTRQSEFLKIVPNTYTDTDGNIHIYPCAVDKKFREEKCGHERDKTCTECTREYWTEEIE